jgi:hypothetical protein
MKVGGSEHREAEVTKVKSAGPDAPVWTENQDALDRWWFARSVYDLATKAPDDWSLRIGVHGPWGSGKSSILGFIRTMAKADGHISVDFNPWGFNSEETMWGGFFRSVLGACTAAGVKASGNSKVNAKQKVAGVMKGAADVLGGEQFVGSAAKMLNALTEDFLQVGRSDLVRLRDDVAPRKILVLVDDVDRVEPHLLPSLLFALKEILDVDGVAFILALDPEMVGKALAAHHPGWGDGLMFIDKIIDFPKRLPDPTPAGLWAIAERDVDTYATFVDKDALRSVFDLCPQNPRALRHFIRHLWSLEQEIARHDPDELSWKAILITQLLKATWPTLARTVLLDPTVLDKIAPMRYFSAFRNRDGQKETVSRIRELCEHARVPPSELNRAEAVVLALIDRTGVPGIQVSYAASLLETPHAVTRREYRRLLESGEAKTSQVLSEWIAKQARERVISPHRVVRGLYELATRSWNQCLDSAAGQRATDAVNIEVTHASEHLSLVKTLAFGVLAFDGPNAPLVAADATSLITQVAKWASWTNIPQYVALRDVERQLLDDLIIKTKVDHVSLYRDLARLLAWPGVSFMDNPAGRAIVESISGRIEPSACRRVLSYLAEPSGVSALWADDQRDLRLLLISPDSSVHKDRSIQQELRILFERAQQDEVVHLNFVDLLFRFAFILDEGEGHSERQQLARLLGAGSIELAVWSAATARCIQPRMQGNFRDARTSIMKATLRELALPSWWPAESRAGNGQE